MQFGWLTLAHSPSAAEDQREIFRLLEQACLAETLGFDGVWLTEHNFTGESVYSDPIPFASALAMRTSRIRIGFAVIQMALRHPVRLATQLSLLDNLCNGRLDIGVGRGSIFNEYEFVGYGLRSGDSRERMAEALEIMVRAWTDTPLDYKGRFFNLSLPELRPVPVQKPHPPDLAQRRHRAFVRGLRSQGCADPDGAVACRSDRRQVGLYRRGLASSGLREVEQARLLANAALWRWIYVGQARAEAEDEFAAALLHTRQHMNHARTELNPSDFAIPQAVLNPWTDSRVADADGIRFALENGTITGTAADVAEQIAELRDAGVGHVLAQMSFGYLGHERIAASMRRFGENVMPKFR